jgi:hypothetical protein
MDHIVKLPSQQALFNNTNNLLDLVIPGNSGVYDLSATYISVSLRTENIELDVSQGPQGQLPATGGLAASTAIADMRLGFNHRGVGGTIYKDTAVPIEILVRDCSMFSSTRGKIEDIRRSDSLRATRKAYLQDMSDVQTAALVGSAGMAKTNPWASGNFAQLVGVGEVGSQYRSHELRIYLKDLFNIAVAEEWDSAVYGDTRIHCELNIDRLKLRQNLGNAAPNPWALFYHELQSGADQATFRANVLVKRDSPQVAAETISGITMLAKYESLEDSPFWVNQMVKITTTITVDAGVTPGGAFSPADGDINWAVIKGITWDKTTKQITLDFGGATLSIPTLTGAVTDGVIVDQSVEGIDVTTGSLVDTNLVYESIELTAVRAPVDSGPKQIQYTQYQTQQDQFSSQTSLARSYFLPPQTTNCIIVLPVTGDNDGSEILGSARLTDYRFSINGETVTNRPVPYMPQALIANGVNDSKCDAGSSLHYDLISKTFMNQGQRFHSLQEAVYDQIIPESTDRPFSGGGVVGWPTLAACPQKRCYMLALPIPISNDQTQLTVELEGRFGADAGRIHIYSEVRSVA